MAKAEIFPTWRTLISCIYCQPIGQRWWGHSALNTFFFSLFLFFSSKLDNQQRSSQPSSRRASVDIELAPTPATIAASSGKSTAHSFSFATKDDEAESTASKKSSSSSRPKYWSWLMWWNTDDWWPCWIGLLFFGCVSAAVQHGIPEPVFLPWTTNPFMTFATVGNYGLIVIFVAMGLLLWLCMASTQTQHWKHYPLGYLIVFFVALVSNMLAANGMQL